MNNSLPRLCRAWLPLVLFLVAAAVLVASWPDRIPVAGSSPVTRQPWANGDVLRVGSPEPVRQATVLSPYGPGCEFELMTGICQGCSCTPEWVVVPDKDAGLAMLREGEIDVLVGFWGDGPAAATDAKATTPEDTAPLLPGIATGKAYAHFNPVRVTGAVPPAESSLPESSPAAGEDRADPDAEETGSPSAVEGMARFFAALIPGLEARAEDPLPAVEDGQPFPVFAHTLDAAGERNDALLLDPVSYALWLPFMGDVSTRRIGESTPFRWFWRDDDSLLAANLAGFWQEPDRKEELEELTERYFGFLPKNLCQRDILELAETLSARLADYEEFIRKAAQETGVPTLLLVAAIYQESRFDPGAVSETRVRGIMQLTAATAKMLNVDRQDPAQCIMGGARYLRELYDKIGGKAATDWDRWFMALGAYNQGMSSLNRTIRIARELGVKGDTWADVKRAFPLNTTCRGREARAFVEWIRYYNFILHGLVALAPAEAQDLAPLLGLAVADNPF